MKPCIAIVSPFLDKQHGTERCVAEQAERLARDYGYEVHIYSQRVKDIAGLEEPERKLGTRTQGHWNCSPDDTRAATPGRLIWHRIPDIPGPHIVKYVWWFLANHLWRWKDQRCGGLRYHLVYSPGINCWDADVIFVHIVFHEFYRLVRHELQLGNNPLWAWPRLLHRRLYYHLAMALENWLYPNPRHTLAAVSYLTARELQRLFGRTDVQVIPNAVDVDTFNPLTRDQRRQESRQRLGLSDKDFVLLLIGNDWKKKGVSYLLDAIGNCKDLPLYLLVVGRDERTPYELSTERLGLHGRVRFVEPSSDALQFYAAADIYVGPSLHDSFALPPAEAMACGLPVITSVNNGGSEMIIDGVDGFVLRDPRNPAEIAGKIRLLYETPDLRRRVGENAVKAARQYRWERNAQETKALLACVQNRRNG